MLVRDWRWLRFGSGTSNWIFGRDQKGRGKSGPWPPSDRVGIEATNEKMLLNCELKPNQSSPVSTSHHQTDTTRPGVQQARPGHGMMARGMAGRDDKREEKARQGRQCKARQGKNGQCKKPDRTGQDQTRPNQTKPPGPTRLESD